LSDFGMARIKQQEVNTTVANIGPIKVKYSFNENYISNTECQSSLVDGTGMHDT